MPDLKQIKKQFLEKLKNVSDLDGLKKIESEFLGRNGIIRDVLAKLKNFPERERKETGKEINALKEDLINLLHNKQRTLEQSDLQADEEWIDISAPGKKITKGHVHPLTKIISEIIEIFNGLGFSVISGPEIETERNNFDALNIPADHPAREMWDTFWLKPKTEFKIKEKLLLRTHTSPVQVRFTQKNNPPFRIIAPGRIFRYEATDASHDFQFWQLEGLMVGDDISVANFKAVIKTFFQELFKKEVKIRLRPSFYPFVEPGFDVDISCIICGGKGCSVCSQRGYLEMAGAGMVHPNVFKAVGYNPKNWQGFAFGFGIDRLAMMKYKISDVRLFRSGDLRFLEQF
jgi:phenylalanyl-tRNA synthetase alpha chain